LSGRPFSVYTQVLQTYIDGQKRYDRADASQASYAVGGFALPGHVRRPPPSSSSNPPENVGAPAAGRAGKPTTDAKRFAIRAGMLHTSNGPPIRDGVVLIDGGKVRQAGKADAVRLPEGTPIIVAPVVTPGLIDAQTVVGVSGRLNVA